MQTFYQSKRTSKIYVFQLFLPQPSQIRIPQIGIHNLVVKLTRITKDGI
jgi:hypothetical protein